MVSKMLFQRCSFKEDAKKKMNQKKDQCCFILLMSTVYQMGAV